MFPLDDLDKPTPLGVAPRAWLYLSLAVLVVHVCSQTAAVRWGLLALGQGGAVLAFIMLCAEGVDAALRAATGASRPRAKLRQGA